ncbi:hypothetical protein LOD99_8873 [Oopsacas minuta]|uniref:Uncharacterized protein n=1 Tax=Oopsacas minuta TaxID=111878 RepID=A0AAV7JEA5_9METZ|nr:hypothetical protein LOD99_8873 [Oopsacas minuta]
MNMSLHPRDRDIFLQLENDHFRDISEIEIISREVKHEFDKFHKELTQKEYDIVREINKIRDKIVEDFNQKKNRLFDTTNQYREIQHDLGVSTHVNILWKKNGLAINDICEIQSSQRRRSHSISSATNPYGDLIIMLNSARQVQSSIQAIAMEYPPEMHSTARQLIHNKQHKYHILPVYELIQHNLKCNTKMVDIQDGLHSLSKYVICLFFDPSRTIFHTIQTDSEYHRTLISNKIVGYDKILHRIDYQYNHTTQFYTIDQHLLSTPQYLHKLASICCELLLAVEELRYFQENTDLNRLDLLTYFSPPPLVHDFEINASVCPITALDVCASGRDASLLSQNSDSFGSPIQSLNYQRSKAKLYSDNDTPNSSVSDTQYNSRTSNCSGDILQSRDRYDVVEPAPTVTQDKFTSTAFNLIEDTNLYSISDPGNNDMAKQDRGNPRGLLQNPPRKVDSSPSIGCKICPKCNKETSISYLACEWCRAYVS